MVLTMAEPGQGSHDRDDDQIEYLEAQVQAYKSRTSLLQRQLLLLLDTLDETEQRHNADLEQERSARGLAQSRLKRHEKQMKALERERDDYRAVVLELIEKVERSNANFKRWPHSKLHLSAHAVPLDNYIMDDFSEQALLDTDMRHRTSHAEIIVASLKRQLYLEQQAHGQTRARANSLAAQVAARDVLLEGLAQNAATSPASHLDDPLLQGNGKGKSAVKANMLDVGRDLDLVEISALFEATAENNRALENDIHALSQKLAETRRKTLLASPRPQHADYDLTFIGPPSTKTSSSLDRPSSYPIQHDQPYSSGSRPGHHVSTPMPPTSSSPRRGRTRPASQPQYPPSAAPEQQPRSQSRQHLPITRRRSPSSPPAEQMVQHLSEQIRLLSVEIDAFHTQRVLLSRVIDSQLHKAEDATVTPEAYHSYDSFDADGDQSFFAGDEDEHGLNTPGQLPHRPQFSPDAADGDGNGDEITEDGERSMEISTPLSSLVTFLASSADGSEAYQEADEGARGGNGGLPEEVEEQDDGQIRMIRPRRALSVSPPAP